MAVLSQPATSTQLVQQQVYASYAGSSYDPTADVVQMAFVPVPSYGSPQMPAAGSPLWNAATWETDTSGGTATYWASCLVGPAGGVVLAQGEYVIAVLVTDDPAVPALWGWQLLIG